VDVARGSALTLIGPSGSGKSSFLRCLNRLEEPTAGVVRFGGRSITELDPRELRRRAALVQQTPVLFEGTVRDNLVVHAAGAKLDVSESRLRETLTVVGLDVALLERDAAMLSGGERQRVTIARALLRDPQALLLDEPTSALDPPNAILVVETICRLRETGGLTIVAVTHTPSWSAVSVARCSIWSKGRVETYEPMHDGGVTDERLQAFLAGTHR
jgi:putative ABC transport system ATP-binding protein